MFEEWSPEEALYYSQMRMSFEELWLIETRCFYLEQRVSRLERKWRKWPGTTPQEQHLMRRERYTIRHELEMMKIDFDALHQRAKPLFKGSPV